MSEFTTRVDLIQKSIFIKELKVKHFKVLLKTLLGDAPNIEEVFENLINILVHTTSYNILELKNLSALDFLLLILHLRCVSIGDGIQLEITDETNTKLLLNLNKVIHNIKDSISINLEQTIKKIKVEYQFLSISDFLFAENTNDEFLFFKKYIKKIHFIDNNSIDISKLNNESFKQLLKQLPADYSVAIFRHITEIIKQINGINLLKHIVDKNLTLYFTRDTFTFILQILFSKNLLPLYENIFALAKFTNLSPEYIEECTPGEYTIFVKLLERILKEQNTQQRSNTLPPINADNPTFM